MLHVPAYHLGKTAAQLDHAAGTLKEDEQVYAAAAQMPQWITCLHEPGDTGIPLMPSSFVEGYIEQRERSRFEGTLNRVAAAGAEHGNAAGSWVIDGNTDADTARRIIVGYEDGDPQYTDQAPAPLSGEWADGPTPQDLQRRFDLSDDLLDEACTVYEGAYYEAYWSRVIADAKAVIG